MKLLAIEISRVTALFRMTRPGGQLYLPNVAAQLADRYGFSNFPRALEVVSGNKAEFKHGLFDDSAIEILNIYTDGIVVESHSDTDFIDKFIDDLNAWLKESHGLSVIATHTVDKMYNSTLLIETDRDIFRPFEAYAGINKMIDQALLESSGLQVQYQNFGLALSADGSENPALKPSPFRIERKEGVEFSLNQFFTTAPLKTKQHVRILEQLDQSF